MARMSDAEFEDKLLKSSGDVLRELGLIAKKDILRSFDQEFGYTEGGKKVTWSPLTEKYVNRKLPKGRGGSKRPILVFPGSGKLRSGIDVLVDAKGFSLDAGVFNERAKISEYLEYKRPHTNINPKTFTPIVKELVKKHWGKVLDEDYERQR